MLADSMYFDPLQTAYFAFSYSPLYIWQTALKFASRLFVIYSRKHIRYVICYAAQLLHGEFLPFLDSIDCPLEISINEKLISKIFFDLFEKERQFILRLQEQSLPFEHHITKGIKFGLLPGIHYKHSFCVRFDALVQYLQQATKWSDVSTPSVSIYLRNNSLVAIDQSKRVTKKYVGDVIPF